MSAVLDGGHPATPIQDSTALESATLRLVIELVALLAVAVVIGFVRPRWSTLSVALVPTALAFAWLLLNEDIPGDETTVSDLAWYAGMSVVVGAAFALACLLGVAARRGWRAAQRAGAASARRR